MTETQRLNKAAILNGRDQVYYEYFDELGGELALHPLTEGQFSQVAAIKAAGSKMSGKAIMNSRGEVDKAATSQNMEITIDLQKAQEMEFESDVLAVAYSLSDRNETWTDREVKRLRPPGIIKKIAKRVMEISEVTPEQIEQVRSFREKHGGDSDHESTPDRGSAGEEPGRADPITSDIPAS